MKISFAFVALFAIATVARAQQADDKGALAPFINEATLGVERYDLTRLDMQATRQWLIERASAAKQNPKQAQYLDYLQKGRDLTNLAQLLEQLKAAGASRVYVVCTTAVLADPPGFLFVPVEGGADAKKITAAIATMVPEPTNSPKEIVVEQINNAIIVAPRVGIAGLKTMRPSDRSDLITAMQAAGDAPIIGGAALSPAVAMIFEQTIPTVPLINRPMSDITRNLRSLTLAATPGADPSMQITVRATSPQAAAVLNDIVSDAAKFAASPAQRGQTPKIPQPQVENDTLKFDLKGDELAGAVFGMIDMRLKSQLIDSLTRIRAILQICYTHKFNVEKGKAWPADLDTLVKAGELKQSFLTNPRFPDQNPGYIYVRPAEKASATTTIVLYENAPAEAAKVAVGFADGHGEIMDAQRLEKMVKQAK